MKLSYVLSNKHGLKTQCLALSSWSAAKDSRLKMHRINVNASLYHEDPVRRVSTPTVRLRAQSTLLGALSFQLLSISGQAKPFFSNATPTAKLSITPLLLWFYVKLCANLKTFMNSGSQAYLNYKNFLIFHSD